MNIQSLPSQSEIEVALGLDGRSRRRIWTKRGLWLAVLATLLIGAGWWFVQSGNQAADVTYQTEPVTRADLVVRVQATGKIQPTTQVDVSSEMSGVVRMVNVDNNSLVKKGDVLAELDSVRLNAQLVRVKASLAAAQARLLDAKATRSNASCVMTGPMPCAGRASPPFRISTRPGPAWLAPKPRSWPQRPISPSSRPK